MNAEPTRIWNGVQRRPLSRAEGHSAYGCVDWYYYKRPYSGRPAEQN